MKLRFNIKVYHGTNVSNINGILIKGFDKDSNSCATQVKEWASGYGNAVLCFIYPFYLYFSFNRFREDLEYSIKFIKEYRSKTLVTCVSGFKPNNVTIIREPSEGKAFFNGDLAGC